MADNVVTPPSGTGDSTPNIAADELTGTLNGSQQVSPYPKTQRIKVAFGSPHSAQDVQADSAAHGLPVQMIAAAQADGHSGTIGTTTDASSTSTLVGLLKAIKAAITGTLSMSAADGAQATIGTTTDLSSASTVVGVLKAIKAAVTGTLAVSMATPADEASTLTDAPRTLVTVPGTAVRFYSVATPCKWLTVTALDTNTGLIVVGGSDVVAASGTQKGLAILSAQQSVTIPISDASKVYIDARIVNDGAIAALGS